MKERKTIKINDFQLHILLNEEEQKGLQILQNNSFCSTCMGERPISNVQAILLNDLNDIEVQGTCPVCGGKMARYMEFGEDQAFSKRADLFRKSIDPNTP
jgi:hypothetical protein